MNWMIVRIGMCPWLLMICIVPFGYCTSILTDLGVNMERVTRLELASRYPANRLAAIRRSPARTSDFNAPSAQVEVSSSSPIPANGKKTGHPIGCPKWSE